MTYTLEQTLKDQKDLVKLCADRPLKTKEIFKPNAYYGLDFIIKKYLGLPRNYSLKLIFPHGPRLGNFIWGEEVKSILPIIAAYNTQYEKVLKNHCEDNGYKKVILPLSFPFLYVLDLLKNHSKPKREGTIFFPFHSTHHITAKANYEGIAEDLLKVEDRFKPITICIYWRDYNLGHHLPFQEKGFNIVSAGHMYDPYFLFRFYHLCSMHLYSASNHISNPTFYSIKAGCIFFYFDMYPQVTLSGEESHLRSDVGNIPSNLRKQLVKLFKKGDQSIDEEKTKVADHFMGTRYFMSPEELLKIVNYAEGLYKKEIIKRILIKVNRFPKRLYKKMQSMLEKF
ncbi:MAG: hypothetical protein ACKVE4_03785 [Dissulfuribacterales bacterium]